MIIKNFRSIFFFLVLDFFFIRSFCKFFFFSFGFFFLFRLFLKKKQHKQ